MTSTESQIQALWEVEQEILDVIHKVCKENGLRYSLMYGSLIGAVRHEGFIPWDDDIDLVMPREDYNKLIQIWDSAAPAGYILQNYYNTPDMTQSFTKILKDHTTFLQNEQDRSKAFHKGIFVDIFPGDRVAPGRLSGKLQFVACAISLLYARGHTSGAGGMMGLIERLLLKLPSKMHAKCRDKAEAFFCRWNGKSNCKYVFASTIRSVRRHYAPDLFENMTTIRFQGKEYDCIRDFDSILRGEYGEYMQLPPESERVWKHHPILVDFEKNYEEIEAAQ